MNQQKEPYRVVIIGGGAAGIALASKLGRRYKRDKQVVVTLIDQQLTHIWKPLLHEVAAGTFDSHVNEISFLAQAKRCGFKYRLGSLSSINRAEKTVQLDAIDGDDGNPLIPTRDIAYDTLILAIGSISNDFGVTGVAEHCLFIDTTQQAENFHRQLVQACTRIFATGAPQVTDPLRIAIVGAGATGVELSAQLREVSELLNSYSDQKIQSSEIQITLIEGADRILPALPDYLSTATEQQLKSLRINVLPGETVSQVTPDAIITQKGTTIPCHIKVWAAGIKIPTAITNNDGLETNRINQLIVRPTLQTSDDHIFAMGDCAACEWHDGILIPPRAQSAHQQATHLAKTLRQVIATERETEEGLKHTVLPPFAYRDYGSLVSLGNHATVGNLMGNVIKSVRVEGLIARMVYLSLYKMHQISLFGFWRTSLLTASNMFRRSVHPAIKLH